MVFCIYFIIAYTRLIKPTVPESDSLIYLEMKSLTIVIVTDILKLVILQM